jgi:hypothetical protein
MTAGVRMPLLFVGVSLVAACQIVIGLDSQRDQIRDGDSGSSVQGTDAAPDLEDSAPEASSPCSADLNSDPGNCGACSHACGAGRACAKGLCEAEPLVPLNGRSTCMLVREDAPVMIYNDRPLSAGGAGTLFSSSTDGRNPVPLVENMRSCSSLLIDNGKLFVGLDAPGAVERMELNGSGRTPLWSGQDRLYKMAIRDGMLYLATSKGVVRMPAHGGASAGELVAASPVGTSLMDVSAEYLYYGLETAPGNANDLRVYALPLKGGTAIASPQLGYNRYLRGATLIGNRLYFGLEGSIFSYVVGDVPVNVVGNIAPSSWIWQLWSDGKSVYAQNRPGRQDEGTIARVDPAAETYLRLTYGDVFESPWGFDKSYAYFIKGINRNGVEDPRTIVRVPR